MKKKIKIVIDENISYALEAFSCIGEVILSQGRKITPDLIADADALIIRSITLTDESLLKNSKVRFVGTATIGYDHVDVEYLRKNKIIFSTAAGCNADAVSEYVFTSIFNFLHYKGERLKGKSLGIIGVGNIGAKVNRMAQSLGLTTILNDPPLQDANYQLKFSPLESALNCDIVTFHTPLDLEGKYKTYHLLNDHNINTINPNALLINASRGEVTSNKALIKYISETGLTTVLDVWENEPICDLNLLEKVFLATPHIAGYSLEGKANGTKIIYDYFCRAFNIESNWTPPLPEVENNEIEIRTAATVEELFSSFLPRIYNIKKDSENLKILLHSPNQNRGEYFDKLRKDYCLRREFSNYTLVMDKYNEEKARIFRALRFKVK